MTKFVLCYIATGLVLWILHQAHKWQITSSPPDPHSWLARLEKHLTRKEHKPRLIVDLVVAALAFGMMYYSAVFTPPADPDWDRYTFVVPALCGVLISVVIVFALGANIAISAIWSRSYPLIAVYGVCVVMIFAKIYVVLGILDGGKSTTDYDTCLYLSMIAFTNSGFGDVVPNAQSRFVAVTEGFIGYAALAFSAALIFITMQRGMRSQIKAYYKRIAELER